MISPYSNSNDCYAYAWMHTLQVFEKRPYESAPLLPTAELAALIVRQYHLTDNQVALYTKHVALLVSCACNITLPSLHGSRLTMHDLPFIREATGSLSQDLHRKFAAWVDEKGLRSPTEEQWGAIMDEDSRLLTEAYNLVLCITMRFHSCMCIPLVDAGWEMQQSLGKILKRML